MEVSQGEDEDSPLETQERPITSPEEATTSADSGESYRNEDEAKQLPHNRKSPIPIVSVLRKCPNQFRASIRTRRFVVDGKEHTTTSKRVFLAEESVRPVENSAARMRALRDFRELAK
ncbi:unnamed protein product, partial [Hydatigera taeniaeformis]|uniref:Uncharacterized protein n=1 Tax=Hydatigena taeniaeformis TaxID=6205 RepID=A0A0R3WYX7_HYDTA